MTRRKPWAETNFNKAEGFFDIGLFDGADAFLKVLKRGLLCESEFINKDLFHIVLAVGYFHVRFVSIRIDDTGSYC